MTAPNAQWIFIADQLNLHQSASLVAWVAQATGWTDDLGEKGKAGILQSMSTRAKFLSNSEHHIRFVYTPKHCSWLNQVEMWFSILVRRLLKRASFTSTDELARANFGVHQILQRDTRETLQVDLQRTTTDGLTGWNTFERLY